MMEVVSQVAEVIGYIAVYLAVSAGVYVLWAKKWRK